MTDRILITGQEGMVGRSVYKIFKKKKLKIIDCKRKNLDFTSQKIVDNWFKKNKPYIVINASGRVGGILDNHNCQSDYLYINTMIGMNVVNACLKYNIKKLINLGSSCIYPKNVQQPIKETSLLSSELEKTNEEAKQVIQEAEVKKQELSVKPEETKKVIKKTGRGNNMLCSCINTDLLILIVRGYLVYRFMRR